MNIFADYHHDGLWKSLEYLFRRRLGHKLYRPVGEEWYPRWWKIGDPYGKMGKLTAFQYLYKRGHSPRPDGTYYYDRMRGVTLDQFKKMPFDIVIATIPQHIEPYKKLIRKFQPNAKLILQMGNIYWDKSVNFSKVPNVMASTEEFRVPKTCNIVFYHQEFNTNVFKYEPPDYNHRRKISSFVHKVEAYPDDNILLKEYMEEMDDYEFKIYGASNPDGPLPTERQIAGEMHDSEFGWHLKRGGDGFGHIIHNWFACGRPPIVKMEYYKDKLAGKLMQDGVTCIAIDGLTAKQGAKKIRRYTTPKKHEKMCKEAYNRFGSTVNFEKEEEDIRKFLDVLK